MMLSRTLFAAVWAASRVVSGLPTDDAGDNLDLFEMDEIIDHVVFKRDDVLTPRDMEIAALNGVDTTQMFKHTVLKRSNGEDYTIWVHNSFTDASPVESGLQARQTRFGSRPWVNLRQDDYCKPQTEYNDTDGNSATTGGATAIVRWTNNNSGYFLLDTWCCTDPRRIDLIIGGTNTGNNMRFSTGVDPRDANEKIFVGSQDIRSAIEYTRSKWAKVVNGGERLGANGGLRCQPGSYWVNFVIGRTDIRV